MGNANRVAGNTVAQYFNLVVNVLCGLYSVRLILAALGEIDYGIYDLIGGVISMLAFLNSTLSQTSVRYLSISIGKGDAEGTRTTFNDCFWLHFILACFLAIVFELLSLILFDGFLNIPADRIKAAKWVYHCVVAVFFLRIIVTPFSALVVSHEKFVYGAIISIANSIAKLIIAVYLGVTHGDKLIIYGMLMASVMIVDLFCYVIFLSIKYNNELHIAKPSYLGMKRMFGFAGWTMVDTIGNVVSRQGYPILLNNFYGAAINAVYGIARQIAGHVYMVSSACIETMKPQVIKSYGANDVKRMLKLSMTAGKMGFILMSFVTIPLFVMMPYVLDLWLVDVPQRTVTFARLLIIVEMVEQLTKGFTFACQAIGNIKWISILVAAFRVLGLPVSVVLIICGYSLESVLYVFIVCESLASFSRVIVTSRLSALKITDFIRQVVLQIIPPYVIALVICYFIYHLGSGLPWAGLTIIITISSYMTITYLWGLTAEERNNIRGIVSTLFQGLQR